jgi:hypothetical protein
MNSPLAGLHRNKLSRAWVVSLRDYCLCSFLTLLITLYLLLGVFKGDEKLLDPKPIVSLDAIAIASI